MKSTSNKPKPLTVYLKNINFETNDLIDDGLALEKDFLPFIVNRCLSYFADTVLYANDMNRHSMLPLRAQYDYLRISVRKRKRFSPWKKKVIDKRLQLVQEYFEVSYTKAKEYLKILTESNLAVIESILEKGGSKS